MFVKPPGHKIYIPNAWEMSFFYKKKPKMNGFYCSLLQKKIRTDFGKNPTEIVGGRLMLFGDFMDIGAEDKKYIEITDREEVGS